MSFTFYGCLDQRWIDTKQYDYDIRSDDVIDLLSDFGFEAKQILESPNPIIMCLIELIIGELIDELERDFNFGWELLDKIRESLNDTVFINSIDSHIGADWVFQQLETEFEEHFQGGYFEPDEEKVMEEMEKLKQTFLKYDF